MEFYKELTPYVKRIMKLDLVNLAEFTIDEIQPIIDDLIDFLYFKRDSASKTDRKHVVSKSLLENFTQDCKYRVYVQKGAVVRPMNIKKNLAFCLPLSKKHFWSQNIEDFFKPIETLGTEALTHFRKQIELNPSELAEFNVNPLNTVEETRMRLLLSLYLAMHVERQAVRSGNVAISDKHFLYHMKILTTSFFFHVWTWCKVNHSTFIVPVEKPILTVYTTEKIGGEYILPLSPTLALFVANNNFASFFTRSYIFDDRQDHELTGWESALLNTSEKVGQQRFIIQTKASSYNIYHSNSRLGTMKEEEYHFSYEFFSRLYERLQEIYPYHVIPPK